MAEASCQLNTPSDIDHQLTILCMKIIEYHQLYTCMQIANNSLLLKMYISSWIKSLHESSKVHCTIKFFVIKFFIRSIATTDHQDIPPVLYFSMQMFCMMIVITP